MSYIYIVPIELDDQTDLEKLAQYRREELHPPKLLTGRDLMALGYKPGPLFKVILDALEDAQLERLVTTREEARRFVGERYEKPGP